MFTLLSDVPAGAHQPYFPKLVCKSFQECFQSNRRCRGWSDLFEWFSILSHQWDSCMERPTQHIRWVKTSHFCSKIHPCQGYSVGCEATSVSHRTRAHQKVPQGNYLSEWIGNSANGCTLGLCTSDPSDPKDQQWNRTLRKMLCDAPSRGKLKMSKKINTLPFNITNNILNNIFSFSTTNKQHINRIINASQDINGTEK